MAPSWYDQQGKTLPDKLSRGDVPPKAVTPLAQSIASYSPVKKFSWKKIAFSKNRSGKKIATGHKELQWKPFEALAANHAEGLPRVSTAQ